MAKARSSAGPAAATVPAKSAMTTARVLCGEQIAPRQLNSQVPTAPMTIPPISVSATPRATKTDSGPW